MPDHDPREEKINTRKHRSEGKQEYRHITRAIERLTATLADQEKTDRDQSDTQESGKASRERLTIFLVFATVCLLIVQDIILHSSDATFKDTLDAQKRSSERQLRAYMGPVFNSFKFLCPTCINQILTPSQNPPAPELPQDFLAYRLKNYGSTPAYRPHACGRLIAAKVEDAVAKRDELFRNCTVFVYMPTIWPGEEREYTIEFALADAVSILKKEITGFVFTRVSYEDVFGTLHDTFVCRQFVLHEERQKVVRFLGCNPEGPQDN